MDQYFVKLEELVFKEKYTVGFILSVTYYLCACEFRFWPVFFSPQIRPIHLIDLFGLHIKQAQL